MVGFYDLFMAPLEYFYLRQGRMDLLKNVTGTLLEIGAGTGANLPFYDFSKITHLTLIDQEIDQRLIQRLHKHPSQPILMKGSVELLPFPNNHFDSVVFTLLFCSVEDVDKGLNEVFRVLKPGGKLFFIEHVCPMKEPFHHVVNLVNPWWHRFSGGCNLNRHFIPSLKKHSFSSISVHPISREIFISGIAIK